MNKIFLFFKKIKYRKMYKELPLAVRLQLTFESISRPDVSFIDFMEEHFKELYDAR